MSATDSTDVNYIKQVIMKSNAASEVNTEKAKELMEKIDLEHNAKKEAESAKPKATNFEDLLDGLEDDLEVKGDSEILDNQSGLAAEINMLKQLSDSFAKEA